MSKSLKEAIISNLVSDREKVLDAFDKASKEADMRGHCEYGDMVYKYAKVLIDINQAALKVVESIEKNSNQKPEEVEGEVVLYDGEELRELAKKTAMSED